MASARSTIYTMQLAMGVLAISMVCLVGAMPANKANVSQRALLDFDESDDGCPESAVTKKAADSGCLWTTANCTTCSEQCVGNQTPLQELEAVKVAMEAVTEGMRCHMSPIIRMGLLLGADMSESPSSRRKLLASSDYVVDPDIQIAAAKTMKNLQRFGKRVSALADLLNQNITTQLKPVVQKVGKLNDEVNVEINSQKPRRSLADASMPSTEEYNAMFACISKNDFKDMEMDDEMKKQLEFYETSCKSSGALTKEQIASLSMGDDDDSDPPSGIKMCVSKKYPFEFIAQLSKAFMECGEEEDDATCSGPAAPLKDTCVKGLLVALEVAEADITKLTDAAGKVQTQCTAATAKDACLDLVPAALSDFTSALATTEEQAIVAGASSLKLSVLAGLTGLLALML